MNKCPKCGSRYENGQLECQKCGIIFKKYEALQKKQKAKRQSLIMKCKVCDKELSKNTAFCPHCGKPNIIENTMNSSTEKVKTKAKNVLALLIAIGALLVILSNVFTSDPSPHHNTADLKKQEREARIAAYNQKTPCERALASYNPQRWYYTQSPDEPQSKWRSVDCATYNCSGYTGTKRANVMQRSFGRVYIFRRTDEPNDSCSENVHQFTCKFDRPKLDPAFLHRDINQVLKNIGVPEISGQLKTDLSFDRSRTYEYRHNNGHNIYIHAEDSWNKDCSYIKSITYSWYEYKE